MIVLAAPKKCRRNSVFLMTLFLLAVLGLFAGCGNSVKTGPANAKAMGPVNVTVSAASGNITQTANVSLTIYQ